MAGSSGARVASGAAVVTGVSSATGAAVVASTTSWKIRGLFYPSLKAGPAETRAARTKIAINE